MKKIALSLAVLIAALILLNNQDFGVTDARNTEANEVQILADAYRQRSSDIQVKGQGEVIRILKDDTEGSRHQRFLLKLSNGQTLLVAHNIDLAPRINSLRIGDPVRFHGEYEWNEKGGVIHWTHHDPAAKHVGGWLIHEGKKYQ